VKHTLQTWTAGFVTAALVWTGAPTLAAAAPSTPATEAAPGPVEGPEAADAEVPAPASLPDIDGLESSSEDQPAEVASDRETETADAASVEPPPPTMQQPDVVRVAVGLSTELDGNAEERELLDELEAGVRASRDPRADVRRLRVGSAEPRELCREGRDDLVINIGYMPDRADPVLLSYDCRIDESLGIRVADAASDPALLEVLWAEHNQRIAEGARERRRARISPKVRTGLIAGAAVAVIGAAVALLIVGAVQRDRVVLVVSPSP